MAELLRSLQDSQLVARFQRRCGLFPAREDSPRENGAGPSERATRVPEVAHIPANPQVTAGRCLRWGGGRRPPAYLRWGLAGAIHRHPASTLGRIRRATVTGCHLLSLQVAAAPFQTTLRALETLYFNYFNEKVRVSVDSAQSVSVA
ncbi:hypothetical protein NN561_002918 [Cricetulus griseus]